MAEVMARRGKARATIGKNTIPPLFLDRHFSKLKELLDEMVDAFPNNACLDAFNHSCKMSGGDLRKITEKHSFPNCIKVCDPKYIGRTYNLDLERLCIFKGTRDARLRFPIHPFINRLLAEIKVHPYHLFPNSWRLIVIFILRCHQPEISLSTSSS